MEAYGQFKAKLREKILQSGRSSEDVLMIVASKYFTAPQIRELYEQGQRDFGENRLQDALLKMEALKDLQIRWHFFGHVQTNKARKVAEKFSVLHSLDSLKLAAMLDKYAEEIGKKLEVFIQVNLGEEDQKSGYEKAQLEKEFAELTSFSNLKVCGLMLITPYFDNPALSQPFFHELAELQKKLNQDHNRSLPNLSMGMSGDFEMAIEEGSTLVRVGTGIFGERIRNRV